MSSFKPSRLAAEESLLETPLGKTLRDKLVLKEVRPRIAPADYPAFAPGDLVLARHLGSFVKPCPGTNGYNCCGLKIIHLGLGCYLDCTYCILQAYLDTEALVLFGNVDEAWEEISSMTSGSGPRAVRYCTGEFTDSLILEDLTGLGARLVKKFARSQGALLELKTKTDKIKGLLDLDHGGNSIISFSVNAPGVAGTEESRAAPLKKRLKAASLAARAGYKVGWHFDPLILHPGWPEGYSQTVEAIYQAVPAEKTAWISLGAFRFLPRLKALVRRRHPQSRIMDEEFVLAGDGKMRYLRPIRVEMYGRLLESIRSADPGAVVYLCMESPRVWQEVFGFDPGPQGLIHMLDHRAAVIRGVS